MISDVAINESIIDDIHDKDLVYSLLALSFEEDTEIKNYAINFILVMFANTQRLTKNLRSITLFRSEDEDLFLELKECNDVLVEVVDYMVSFRTTNAGDVLNDFMNALMKILDVSVIRNHKYPKRLLDEPEKELMPMNKGIDIPLLTPFRN